MTTSPSSPAEPPLSPAFPPASSSSSSVKCPCVLNPAGVRNRSLAEARTAGRWRAVVEGGRVRRAITVTTLAPGMIAVRLEGPPALLERMGLQVAAAPQAARAAKQLAWISLDPRRFSGSVVQGEALLDPCAAPAGGERAGTCVRINGGYFNYRQRACSAQPEPRPIGPLNTAGGRQQPALPVPSAFAGDYHQMMFADGSSFASAPLLAERGEPVFGIKAAGNPMYRLPPDFCFERGDLVPPGVLWHAHDANPRAAISLPSSAGSGRIRLVAAPMGDRSCADSGWTLTAFSAAMARLDRQQSPPNVSLNLDGGESVALLAWVGGRPLLDVRQTLQPRRVGNLVEFHDGPPQRSPRMVRCVKLET